MGFIQLTQNYIAIQHYPFFQWQLLEIEGVDSDNFQPVDKDEKIVIDLLKQLLDIGMYINKTPKHYVKQAFETLFVKNTEFIPSQGVINYLLNEEIDCISTVDEMLRQLDTPYDTTIPSDYVWPLPNNTQLYNYLFQ
ncbi:hypothetical protein HELRODRAFT_162219 [Helobdella robusta]|uniref:Uncharacterized protein n=1 Tax=Helobdella robusta TaxID=6412 RepID=T1ESD3_HELRO|nr:hypothetical protein HELRODRAFT_162219 [Helobdella robusta]ESN98764.1 hypothetical protein HELRODRAFT_162219 [Helobdella robusta]